MINLSVALVILRLFTAVIFAVGSVALMYYEKTGWGWCVFASICLGCITTKETNE